MKLIEVFRNRLIEIKKRRQTLAKLELKLRSMRSLAVYIKDEADLSAQEESEVKAKFNQLENEVKALAKKGNISL